MNDNSIKIDSNYTPTRIVELDAIRGLAAIAVLFCHLPRGFWFGETGVDLFFVLSGFLITGIILRNSTEPRFLRVFYWRRSLRIFPVYYLSLVVVCVLNSVRHNPENTAGMPYFFLYLQNVHMYWGGTTPSVPMLGHTWTLALEEQFYLFWPFALILVPKRAWLWLIVSFVILPVILRSFGLPRTVLLGHTDGLALGALLAWIMLDTTQDKWSISNSVYAGIALISFTAYWGLWISVSSSLAFTGKDFVVYNPAIVLISLTYFGLIGWLVNHSGNLRLSWMRNKWLVSIGTISYGLYLYHWIVYELLDTIIKFRWGFKDALWLDVLKIASSFIAAILSWQLIEKPLLRFKNHFKYHHREDTESRK